jgi:hypothetical protein
MSNNKKINLVFCSAIAVFVLVVFGLISMMNERAGRNGTVINIVGRQLELETFEGQTFTVTAPDDAKVTLSSIATGRLRESPTTFAEIRVGDSVLIKEDKTIVEEVVIGPRE